MVEIDVVRCSVAPISGQGAEAGSRDVARRPIRIGLLWHSASSGNLGVGALTVANLAIARDVALEHGLEPTFVIFGMRDIGIRYLPVDAASTFEIDTKSLLSPRGFWAAVGGVDCVLDIGAGDSFADIYGLKRFIFLWLTKVLTLARGRPLFLSPQTIGPFTKQGYRQLARWVLERSTAVVARDEMSLTALKGLAPRAAGSLAVDVAFALPFEDRRAERGGRAVKVGVNVSGLLFNEAESGRNRFGLSYDYAKVMRRLLASLSGRDDLQVHLVTHALHATDGWDDDGRLADRLAAEFPAAVRVPDFPGPSEAKSYISGLDLLIAGRMHACIGAFSSGTPVVPVAYSRKFTGLFGMLGYGAVVPVSGMDDDEVLALLLQSIERRDMMAEEMAQGMSKVQALLDAYKSKLVPFFHSVIEPKHQRA